MSANNVRRQQSELISFSPHDVVDVTAILESGHHTQRYIVDRIALCRSSAVLKDSCFIEPNGTVELPDFYPVHFETYLNWLCCGALHTLGSQTVLDQEYGFLVECYILGVTLEDAKYCEVVIDGIKEKAQEESDENPRRLPDAFCMKKAFEPTPKIPKEKAAAIQKVILDVYAGADDPQKVVEVLEKAESTKPGGFTRGLIQKLMEDRRSFELLQLQQKTSGKEGNSDDEPARKRVREE